MTKYTHKCGRCGEELKASTKRLLFVGVQTHDRQCTSDDLMSKLIALRSETPKNSTSPADKENV